jgi:hypothetical protein
MPAAVSENTPQDDFGLNLANRRCSERRAVSRLLHQRPGKAEGKRRFTRCRTEGPERQGGVAVTEPPGGRGRSSDRNQPPDGTGRRQRCRAMKAGSSRVTEKRKNGQARAARVERSRFIAPSGTAIAQVARIQSRRAWGWWKHRPHLRSLARYHKVVLPG